MQNLTRRARRMHKYRKLGMLKHTLNKKKIRILMDYDTRKGNYT
jgi:hypothetical protein